VTSLLPFTNDVTIELFDEAQGLVVGYMFASAGQEPVAQEQRWVLYPEYQSPPVQSVIFRFPLKEGLQFPTVERFLEAVCGTGAPLWRSAARYVKVVAQNFDSVPREIPDSLPFPVLTFNEEPLLASSLLGDDHPGRGHGRGRGRGPQSTRNGGGAQGGVQIDDCPATLASRANTSTPEGYVFGTSIKESSMPGIMQNIEYWVTLPGYVPANTSTSLFLNKDTNEQHKSLSGFFDAMRTLEGARLTVASCVYAGEFPSNP
jgi:hypothetical protein